MTSTLCILCCHNFQEEVGAGVTAEGWTDVVVAGFPANCGRPPLAWDDVRRLLPEHCSQVVVLGNACVAHLGQPPADFPPLRVEPQGQCFHLIAGPHLVDDAMAGGGYLISPAWLEDWRGQLRKLGFDPEQAGEFFHDFASELVLLDTRLDAETRTRLAELQAVVKLPARRLAVGLDHLRPLLSRLVLQWRLDQAQRGAREQNRHHAAELADHVAAMDLLTRLARTQSETEAIAAIRELFQMLFAPAALYYLRLENDVAVPCGEIPGDMLATLRALPGEHAWTPDGQGFLLRISHGDEKLGLLAVDRLAFPAYRERYLNMALAVTGVCGLAIENARNRRRLLEAEKMASLSILVAGVAHEINTPLGVSLAASSTLEDQSRHLAERFAARSMTQSDLSRYLDTAATSTGLMRQNLERIGRLIDAFRQVAVAGNTFQNQRFRLRACLDEVVASLGERLAAAGVELTIDCAPELEIDGVAGDWASILGNLIGNSLKHGFKDRRHGRIDIRVARLAKNRLRVDFRDDGLGMAPDVQARIFDPFFTTDLQQGMGLGLHLVYNLITQRMGGSIRCESAPEQGAHFQIELPLAPPAVSPAPTF